MSKRRGRIIQSSHRFHGPCSACGDGDKAMEFHTHKPPMKSYTLAQLSTLARQYVNDARNHRAEGDVVEVELQLSLWLAWMQRAEKGNRQ